MSKKSILTETQVLRVLESSKPKRSGVLRVMEGIFSVADSVGKNDNRNKRLYSENLLRNRIVESPYTKEMLTRGCLFGEADHPESRMEISIKDVSHRITELSLKEGLVVGKIEVLDTPVGRVVDTLIETGAQMGISSRGAGTTKQEDGKERVNEEDYVFMTYDLVLNPGFGSAIVRQVGESVEIEDPSAEKVISGVSTMVESMDLASLRVVRGVLESANSEYYKPVLTKIEEKLKASEGDTKPLTEAKKTLLEQSKRIKGLNSEITKLKESLASKTTEVQRTVAETGVLKARLNSLRKKLQETTNLHSSLEQVNTELSEECKSSKEAASKLVEATKKLDEVTNRVNKVQGHNKSYRTLLVASLSSRVGVAKDLVESMLPGDFTEADFNRVAEKLRMLKVKRPPIVERATAVSISKSQIVETNSGPSSNKEKEDTVRLSNLVKNIASTHN